MRKTLICMLALLTLLSSVLVACGGNTSKASEGLDYRLKEYDTPVYSVDGIGTCTDTDIVIPSTYNGKSVTSIGKEAFEGCSKLTGVTIGDRVISIQDYAFADCTGLKKVIIPDSVELIDEGAFSGCTGLTDITYNGTKEQWNEIEKYDWWDESTGNFTVHCTDGNISKADA